MKAKEKNHTEPTSDTPTKTTDGDSAEAADNPTDAQHNHDVPTSADDNPPTAENEPEAAALTPEMEALIAEAEQRGYMRGRNESIEELMRRPAMMQTITPADSTTTETDEPMILGNQRISIWDR